MDIVTQLGKSDKSTTFTGNPKWPELISTLNEGEQPCDRPDLCYKTLKLKLTALIKAILKKEIVGAVQANIVITEFQERGCHMQRFCLS
ncbi:protein f33h12.6 [Plakobranchus ocellatus]|uniref:Protein f33h12.6 n=1 Tax=Plakobranchus ocellatus TaxID=259542 RepID=A0AAV4A6E2_9GAST|nr:protein f33h12.6 [Plakobranchus ocellatus]